MKHLSLLLYCLLFAGTIFSQQQAVTPGKCGTDFLLSSFEKQHPGYKAVLGKASELLQKTMISRSAPGRNLSLARTSFVIPVVVHVVLPDPASVSDAEIQQQLDILNRDYSGYNADSTNISPNFPYSLRGHSGIQFCLARTDPSGNGTSGIERRCSYTQSDMTANDPVKITGSGGLDSWDPAAYFNIWVGNFNVAGVLGLSTYPFSYPGYPSPENRYQGVVISRNAFGTITSTYAFNRGRTLVHETGHFFGLFHNFEGGCSDQDFSILSVGNGLTDDTPPQSNSTGSGGPTTNHCPTGIVGSGCTAAARLYQNFMDYTDDPCMSLFTVNQVLRMETAIDLFRPTLKTSGKCQPPPLLNNNLLIKEMRNPYGGPGGIFTGCNGNADSNIYCSFTVPYLIQPVITVQNMGTNAVSSVEIGYANGNGQPVFQSAVQFSPVLLPGAETTIRLSPIELGNGYQQLKVFTRLPNNVPDDFPLNDTVLAAVFVDVPSSQPVREGFEGNVFPPAGWKVLNHDLSGITWEKTASVAATGAGSAVMRFFDYNTRGSLDDLVSPSLDVRDSDSVWLNFAHAYRAYGLAPNENLDSLEIIVSEDCGNNFKTVWKSGGSGLTTNPDPTGSVGWKPVAADWMTTRFDIKPFISPGVSAVRVGFRSKNGFGQNLYLDDIFISAYRKPSRDAVLLQVTDPSVYLCNRTVRPTVLIRNDGRDTLRRLQILYSIDNGNIQSLPWTGVLPSGQSVMLILGTIVFSADGSHQLRAFVSSPNELPDQHTANDSASVQFTIVSPAPLPLQEGFEQPGFPPVNWNISTGWEKAASVSFEGNSSILAANRRLKGKRVVADLTTPLLQVDNNADSVFARFNLSYVPITHSANGITVSDTLEVLLTKDCGKTLTPVYKKWGSALQTISTPYTYSPEDTTGFVPLDRNAWRMDSVNLTGLTSGSFQLVFRNTGVKGNNLYLDNIRVNQLILPLKLKEQGFIILPNPVKSWFTVQHYLPPLNLKGIQVVNVNGQKIWSATYGGNAPSLIPVDLSGQPDGVYFIRLVYADKVITQRIIKLK